MASFDLETDLSIPNVKFDLVWISWVYFEEFPFYSACCWTLTGQCTHAELSDHVTIFFRNSCTGASFKPFCKLSCNTWVARVKIRRECVTLFIILVELFVTYATILPSRLHFLLDLQDLKCSMVFRMMFLKKTFFNYVATCNSHVIVCCNWWPEIFC